MNSQIGVVCDGSKRYEDGDRDQNTRKDDIKKTKLDMLNITKVIKFVMLILKNLVLIIGSKNILFQY